MNLKGNENGRNKKMMERMKILDDNEGKVRTSGDMMGRKQTGTWSLCVCSFTFERSACCNECESCGGCN